MSSESFSNSIKRWTRIAWHRLPVNARMLYWDLRERYVPYQNIIYGGRVLLRGRDRTEAYRLVFPTPPTGKTILDVGCHSGFYCFMAASEGARECVGVDIDRRHLSRGESVLKRHKIPGVHLINMDGLQYGFPQSFDVVLCLNVLQHLESHHHAATLLTKLVEAARNEVVLMFPTTRASGRLCTTEFINRKRYLLFSVNYLIEKADPYRVLHEDLPAHLYGPNRVLARVVKSNSPC